MNVEIKHSALARIAAFLRATQADMHASLVFSRAAAALVLHLARGIKSRGVIAPAAVVAHYDGATTFRLFDSLEAAFAAYVEYKVEGAPVVLLTLNSITVGAFTDEDEE